MKTLIVFPSDPLIAYVRKGEVKERYFNPNNQFESVIIVDCSDIRLDAKQKKLAQRMVGDAELTIYQVNVASRLKMIAKLPGLRRRVAEDLKKYSPDCVRAYGLLAEGVLAASTAKRLGIPFVLSLHDNFDDIRRRYRRSYQWKKWLFYKLWKPLEVKTMRAATRVIGVYGYAAKYATDNGVPEDRINIIYNKIHEHIFHPPKKRTFGSPMRIIFVSRMVWEKGQDNLIKAMKGLEGKAELTLIGEGDKREEYEALVRELELEDTVTIIPRVDNDKLGEYYRRMDVLASPIKYGGVGIPILEAMATGLPIVHAIYPWEPHPDIISEIALHIENTPVSFHNTFVRLIERPELRKELSKKSRQKFEDVTGKKMERAEQRIYEEL